MAKETGEEDDVSAGARAPEDMSAPEGRIAPEDMIAPERRQAIVERASHRGRVEVAELSELFNVTTETVRRDLNQLQSLGVLRRVHGGAVTVGRLELVPSVDERTGKMLAEKRAIARAALAEVPQAGSVIIDAGTTTARLVDVFPGERDLTVVTNSLQVADGLLRFPRLEVMLLGGVIGKRTKATSDAWALAALSQISADVVFLATTGISVRRGLTTGSYSESVVKRAMMAAASRVVVLADSSKIGVVRTFIVGGLDLVDQVITDGGIADSDVRQLSTAGVEVTVVRQ